MLLPQFDGQPFAPYLRKEIAAADRVDIATAWVRASGLRHIREALEALLDRGGTLRVVVGLDAENSSVEGLRELLAIGDVAANNAQLYVRHNESYPVYHPKLYATRHATQCRILVGSNNLTGSGLFLNEEMSAILHEKRDGKLEKSLDDYFMKLTDLSTGLVKPLDSALIDQLVDYGYVRPEANLPGKAKNRMRHNAAKGSPLFASKAPKRQPPKPPLPKTAPRIEPKANEPVGNWQRVFLRLQLARGTQSQIPISVVRAIRARLGMPDLDGPVEVAIADTTRGQRISPTYTKRQTTPNTYKFEAFKPKGSALLRIELVGDKVVVQKLDGNDPAGEIIENFILEGLKTEPPLTQEAKPHDQHSTLWRFD